MSDKCQHCTEVQVRLDMSMEIARLEAELEAMTTERNVAVSNIGKRGRRVVELEAVEERLLKRVAELESELEANAWKISPAMAQAQIDQLNAELAKLKAENQWHPASVRPDHNRQIIIATASGNILHGNRFNLMMGDRWRELPKPPKDVRQ